VKTKKEKKNYNLIKKEKRETMIIHVTCDTKLANLLSPLLTIVILGELLVVEVGVADELVEEEETCLVVVAIGREDGDGEVLAVDVTVTDETVGNKAL